MGTKPRRIIVGVIQGSRRGLYPGALEVLQRITCCRGSGAHSRVLRWASSGGRRSIEGSITLKLVRVTVITSQSLAVQFFPHHVCTLLSCNLWLMSNRSRRGHGFDVDDEGHYPTRPVDKDKAEQELVVNIKKATSPEESAPKQKHVRSVLEATHKFLSDAVCLQSALYLPGTTTHRFLSGADFAFSPS